MQRRLQQEERWYAITNNEGEKKTIEGTEGKKGTDGKTANYVRFWDRSAARPPEAWRRPFSISCPFYLFSPSCLFSPSSISSPSCCSSPSACGDHHRLNPKNRGCGSGSGSGRSRMRTHLDFDCDSCSYFGSDACGGPGCETRIYEGQPHHTCPKEE